MFPFLSGHNSSRMAAMLARHKQSGTIGRHLLSYDSARGGPQGHLDLHRAYVELVGLGSRTSDADADGI